MHATYASGQQRHRHWPGNVGRRIGKDSLDRLIAAIAGAPEHRQPCAKQRIEIPDRPRQRYVDKIGEI